jgi:hypothetical protein
MLFVAYGCSAPKASWDPMLSSYLQSRLEGDAIQTLGIFAGRLEQQEADVPRSWLPPALTSVSIVC